MSFALDEFSYDEDDGVTFEDACADCGADQGEPCAAMCGLEPCVVCQFDCDCEPHDPEAA